MQFDTSTFGNSRIVVDPTTQQCGRLKNRYGISWQILPSELSELLGGPDPERSRRGMAALLKSTG